jgi:hypothetical protein
MQGWCSAQAAACQYADETDLQTQTVDVNHGGDNLQPDAIYRREQSSGVADERAVMNYTAHNVSHIVSHITKDCCRPASYMLVCTEHAGGSWSGQSEDADNHVSLHIRHKYHATSAAIAGLEASEECCGESTTTDRLPCCC